MLNSQQFSAHAFKIDMSLDSISPPAWPCLLLCTCVLHLTFQQMRLQETIANKCWKSKCFLNICLLFVRLLSSFLVLKNQNRPKHLSNKILVLFQWCQEHKCVQLWWLSCLCQSIFCFKLFFLTSSENSLKTMLLVKGDTSHQISSNINNTSFSCKLQSQNSVSWARKQF